MEQTQLLEQVFAEVQRIVDGVRPDQMTASTPCTEWDVRALLTHMTGAVVMFGNGLTGADTPRQDDLLGDDPAGAFRRATRTTLDAWRQPGVMERTLSLPIGEMPAVAAANLNIVDTFTHGADLAVATGQEESLDADLAERALSLSKELGIDSFRVPGVFDAEVPCEESAPAYRRLLAYLGREV